MKRILMIAGLSVCTLGVPAMSDTVTERTIGSSKLLTIETGDQTGDTVTVYRGAKPLSANGSALSFAVEATEDSETVNLVTAVRSEAATVCRGQIRRDIEILERRARYEVCFDDLLPLTEDTSAELYNRLERASRRACPRLSTAPRAEVDSCRADSVERAVYDLGEPLLISEHLRQLGRPDNTLRVSPAEPL
ncbi:MAG: hypothetical protein AAF613_00890 [Pseudomonadota bacterium]